MAIDDIKNHTYQGGTTMKRITTFALALALIAALALTGCSQPAAAVSEEPAVNPFASKLSSEVYAEAEKVNPEGKTIDILLVIDMQKDFVDGALGTAEAQAIVPAVVAKIEEYKAKGGVIIGTKDTHEEGYLETQEGVNLPVVHCVENTPGWELDAAVGGAMPEDALIINKPVFGSTDLVGIIGEYVAEYGQPNVNVEIIGLCTDICVTSNAILQKSFYPEMPISLDAACCAGVTPESHDAALITLGMCQIQITNND